VPPQVGTPGAVTAMRSRWGQDRRLVGTVGAISRASLVFTVGRIRTAVQVSRRHAPGVSLCFTVVLVLWFINDLDLLT
jgi:hypothetical protein